MSDIKLIQLNSYQRPVVKEDLTKEWVLNGKKNEFYQQIINAINGSTTNSSIINSLKSLIYGRGLSYKGNNIEDWVKLATILNQEDLKRIISDYVYFNEGSIQVIKDKGKELSKIAHIAKENVVPNKANDDNEILRYWYSNNWSNIYKNENKPIPFSAFGTSKDAIEIYNISNYSSGKKYFSDPDWLSAMPYCFIEEEIANFYLNSIKKGLSAGYIINVDSTGWSDEQKEKFERKVKEKLTGSPNAMDFIISFNGKDVEVKIVPFPVNDQMHKQWEVLSDQARQKILTAHRVTSPALVGVISSSGFSNTADEMDVAESQFIKRVVKSKQDAILGAITNILENYNINLDLFFKPLTEIEEQKTTVSLNKNIEFTDKMEALLFSYSEPEPEGFELQSVEYNFNLSAIQKSEQDTDIWKVRYAYSKGTSKTPQGESRSFCNTMIRLANQGRVYRKEDIEAMSERGVNGEFAHSGGKYDIFLYAGGVNCYHRWERRLYKKKLQDNGKPYIGNALQNTNEVNVSEARRQGFRPKPNPRDVAIAEIDKPNKGRYNG